MKTAPLPNNEDERLDALARYQILDTSAEATFDELTRLAARLCGTSMALISFVDRERLWFKSRFGWEITESSRDMTPCQFAILESKLLEISNALLDERFSDSPYVTAPPTIRFYAGMPLTTPDGYNLGTLCVLHNRPYQLSVEQREGLSVLTRQVMTQLELRRHLHELARKVEEQKLMEQRLMDSESFFQALVESLPQNIIRKDAQGRFIFANQKFCQSIGRTAEELLGRTDFDFFPMELAGKYHRDDLRVMATRENLDTVEAYQTPQGDKLFVHVIKTPLYDAQGKVVGIQGIFWDVTQRKRIEEALAYERDLLRALLDNIPDRIYFKDVHSRFLRCSNSMARRLGMQTPSEVVGKTDFDFHPRELAQEFFNDEQRIILTGKPMINKLEKQSSPNGEEIWASVTKIPIYNQNGAVTGIIGISRDVTKLKKAEQELEQARDAALESVRVKSQFLANMSHEIRTPMNAITGMTGLLKDTDLNQEQREFVDTIGNSTATLLAIINEILDFSKLEARKIELETIDFDLRHLLESTSSMMADSAQAKGLELGCFLHADVPCRLRGDPGRLRQVLTNLLSNAVKFTDAGEVLMEVRKISETPGQASIRFSVTDSGIGMAPEILPQIFDAFTQADGSTTRKYGGTGLGLTISKQLVQLMGGEISVSSAQQKGSEFSFELSFLKQPSTHEPPPPPETGVLAGKNVLVVDDSKTNRQILLNQLGSLGMNVEVAATYQDALHRLTGDDIGKTPFDLVLVDMNMPEGSGWDFARALAPSEKHGRAALVAITPYRYQYSREELYAAGFVGRLIKPVRLSRLRQGAFSILTRGNDMDPDQAKPAETPKPKTDPIATPASAVEKKARILLAEDNAVNQRVALSQLKKLGYSAVAVTNGAEVLNAMMHAPYDIILMDCQMPEMDGYEVTKRIRQAEKNPHAKISTSPYIIALTANSMCGDRERCLEAGMNDYLTKPIDLNGLERVLQRATRNHPPFESSSAAEAHDHSDGSSGSEPSLDRSVLNGLKELRIAGHPDPLEELVEMYLKDSDSRLSAMKEALESQETTKLAAVVHSLKGSSNNLGARRLGELCRQLEDQAKTGDLSGAEPLLDSIKQEFNAVKTSLREEL